MVNPFGLEASKMICPMVKAPGIQVCRGEIFAAVFAEYRVDASVILR
jgi:hypothetical protein